MFSNYTKATKCFGFMFLKQYNYNTVLWFWGPLATPLANHTANSHVLMVGNMSTFACPCSYYSTPQLYKQGNTVSVNAPVDNVHPFGHTQLEYLNTPQHLRICSCLPGKTYVSCLIVCSKPLTDMSWDLMDLSRWWFHMKPCTEVKT